MTKAFTDDFEIRSSMKNTLKKYYAKGYASFKGLDTQGTSISPAAMKKIAKDLKSKDMKVGIQHDTELSNRILNRLATIKQELMSDNKSTKLIDEAMLFANKRMLPLGKPREVTVDEDGVFVEVEINPYLRNLEPEYYDAIINMLEEQYLDGFSIEFDNASMHDEYDGQGRRFTIIDDLDTMGLELVSSASNPGARITEVFCRMAGVPDKKSNEEEKMTEEMVKKEDYDKLETKFTEMSEQLKKLTAEKETATASEETLKAEAEALKAEHADSEKSFKEKLDDFETLLRDKLSNQQLPTSKSIVNQEDKFGKPAQAIDETQTEKIKKSLENKDLAALMKEAAERGVFGQQSPGAFM